MRHTVIPVELPQYVSVQVVRMVWDMLQQRTPRAASQMRSRIVLEVRFRRGERPQQQWMRVVRVKFMRERTTATMSWMLFSNLYR